MKHCAKCDALKNIEELNSAGVYCKECHKENNKEFLKNNPNYDLNYYKKNKKHILKVKAQYELKRRQSDPIFKLKKNLRSRLNRAIKSNQKSGSAVKDLGCTVEQLKSYIESKWTSGMSWDNHGYNGWHLDHITPLSKFNLNDPEEFKKACHYTNLQPMWKLDHIEKTKEDALSNSPADKANYCDL